MPIFTDFSATVPQVGHLFNEKYRDIFNYFYGPHIYSKCTFSEPGELGLIY